MAAIIEQVEIYLKHRAQKGRGVLGSFLNKQKNSTVRDGARY